ncbi:bifunctional 3-oxoadipate enol-lactonase/4-carboxymuconolactone decarboxylase PcaDC [Actinacidiphila bryophytorum]|uniref:4-carboxymuconolactone decarboxylase /3-oxoadipate enol-lactonase n=1 Tax=Actinacidiphila bryophytorum TaxID=1436133 RepID=A0A9W4MK09_9ACTN|nr:alpha/beta fold hydrolase [Actinacidiphila bryophytorum]CAG7653533.1 4-carboxymuconolactone decarboxylase /3-oxoadipate enol-lactonase [Actinacidiphila bryophytorum]
MSELTTDAPFGAAADYAAGYPADRMADYDDMDDMYAGAPPLQYRFDGPEGAPVLVLGPALGATWHMWDRQLPMLTTDWRVLRYELPGHGGAPAEPASSVDDLARRLLAVLDDEGIDTFGYAGCALGAAIGARLALLRPDRVAALALVSAAARFGSADTWRQRGVVVRANGLDRTAQTGPKRWFTDAFLATQPAITEWAVQMVASTDPACYVAACEALAAFDIRDSLGSIGVPTLVVAGADDTETPPADARLLVAGIPDARLAVVPATGHLAPVEEPTAVGELLATHFGTAWQDHAPAAVPLPPPPVPPVPPARLPASVTPDRLAEGSRIRGEVIGGSAGTDRPLAPSGEGFGSGFDAFATRYAWGEIWARPGLDRRTRACVTLTALAVTGQLAELGDHVRGALRIGLSPAEIEEVLMHTAVYCGVPAARAALAAARTVVEQETGAQP